MARKRYFGNRLGEISFILAGPILRQVSPSSFSVWIACQQPVQIRLRLYRTHQNGQTIGAQIWQGQGQSVAVGQALHMSVVTAQGTENLEASQIYAYDLTLTGNDITVHSLAQWFSETETLSYFRHGLPTFVTPPEEVTHLKILHGSCRKPHGKGQDLLPLLDQMLGATAGDTQERIQQVYFTGDQIYGDDVADALLWVATDVGDMLLGWTERLPLNLEEDGAVYESYALKPGVRSDIARNQAGLTSTLGKGEELANSHFFALGEYLAAYLLVWSPSLWPDQFPTRTEIKGQVNSVAHWDEDVQTLQTFVAMLPQVRRALANVATYMICDDHDISDDWYLNREWCERVLKKPLGYRVVFNGLLAYALCQAWGNTPEQFFPGQPGASLLAAIETWSTSHGQDEGVARAIARYLGLPDAQNPSLFQGDGDVDILDHHPDTLKWHYWVRSYSHEVLVLDTRTWRGYPQGKSIDPPMLLCPRAFAEQLEQPLAASNPPLTLVVLPTNLVALSMVDWVQKWDWCRDRVFTHDVGDSWNFHEVAFTKLLLTLSHHRQRLILLSGDIHYSCAVRLQVWPNWQSQFNAAEKSAAEPSILVQLTASAIKNAEWATQVIHSKLKALLPEPSEDWLVWTSPTEIHKQVFQNRYRSPQHQLFSARTGSDAPRGLPDWRYQLEWLPRQSAQKTPFQLRSVHTDPSPCTWLWGNRWFQEGPEVVGRNNLCQVSFQEQQGSLRVVQDSYWLVPWRPRQVFRSRFWTSIGQSSEHSNKF